MFGIAALAVALTLVTTPTAAPKAGSEAGSVSLPLDQWEQMLDQVHAGAQPEVPPLAFSPIDRRIDGAFRRGLFSATLVERFVVLTEHGHVRVPVLDSAAALGEVLLDGKPTSLLNDGPLYTVGVDAAGSHEIKLRFYWGREQDRFTRRLQFHLPEGGATHFRIELPEEEIEARLASGALVGEQPIPGGTQLEGQLDASGTFDLGWVRRATHRGAEQVRLEIVEQTILTVHESLCNGFASVGVAVVEGETDRVDLQVPEGVEVVRVEGPAVLQWRTEPGQKGRLTVLLRYLVAERTPITVQYQYPFEATKSAPVKLVLPETGVALTGSVGIQAPAGLAVKVLKSDDATELSPRDVPSELSDLTPSPLLSAFTFTAPPHIELGVSRHREVELTNTLVDELQASTVLLESGQEVTKLKLRVRNNARQYLTLKLPPESTLTHCLIDGEPVRPAAGADPDSILLPLRQSERIPTGAERTHVVRAGETLTGIANFYYSDPGRWRLLLDHNRGLLNERGELTVGQVLQVPARQGAVVEESSFIIEVAYKRTRAGLGRWGALDVALPGIDADTVDATWHVYLPGEVRPLRFEANLTPYSAVRYDPFRRLSQFLQDALWIHNAWASSGKYQNILSQRRSIYKKEEQGRQQEEVLSSFPLVGERYRFKRILLGHETPHLHLDYADLGVLHTVRWVALFASLALTWWGFRRGAHSSRRLLALFGFGALLVLAQSVLGVHRRLVWGADLALLAMVLLPRRQVWFAQVRAVAASPWSLLDHVRLSNLFLAVGLYALLHAMLTFPLLLSVLALIGLSAARFWQGRAAGAGAEVSHA